MKRITIRFNDIEELKLKQFKKTYGVETDSEALKMAVDWCLSYMKNVTDTFFPSDYDVYIMRKRKTQKQDLKVYHQKFK